MPIFITSIGDLQLKSMPYGDKLWFRTLRQEVRNVAYSIEFFTKGLQLLRSLGYSEIAQKYQGYSSLGFLLLRIVNFSTGLLSIRNEDMIEELVKKVLVRELIGMPYDLPFTATKIVGAFKSKNFFEMPPVLTSEERLLVRQYFFLTATLLISCPRSDASYYDEYFYGSMNPLTQLFLGISGNDYF
jgi:hypothetical protein